MLSRLHRRPIHLHLWSLRRDGKKVKVRMKPGRLGYLDLTLCIHSHKKIKNLTELIIGKLHQM